MHSVMAIDASGDGDRYTTGWRRRFPERRSMSPGIVIMYPGMTIIASIDESRDDDRCIPGWRSKFPWMAIDASRDGFLGWRSQHPWMAIDPPGMVIMHPWMVIIASRDGDLEMANEATGMAIDTSRDGDRYIPVSSRIASGLDCVRWT